MPWDDPDDPAALRAHADELGIGFDAMNSNTFQDNPSTTGSGASPTSSALSRTPIPTCASGRSSTTARSSTSASSSARPRSRSGWPTAPTIPGQADFRRQFERVADGLRELHDALPPDWELLVEHKPYEPAFYSTVNADWGSSLLLAQHAGERTRCLVDLGHHLPNANIEQVVSRLAMVGRLGGFHFNDSKYGDDDLTVGSIHPYQFFLIVCELVEHGNGAMPPVRLHDRRVAQPQGSDRRPRPGDRPDPVHDRAGAARRPGDRCGRRRTPTTPRSRKRSCTTAFRSDVRPVVAEARRRNGAALAPLTTFRRIGYRAAVTTTRGDDAVSTGL